MYADAPEAWQWAVDDHSADELTALELEQIVQTVPVTTIPPARRTLVEQLHQADDATFAAWCASHAQPAASGEIHQTPNSAQVQHSQLDTFDAGYVGYAGGAQFNAAYVPPQHAHPEAPTTPVIIQLDPLVQAPPLSTDAAYTDFIWRYYAAQQTTRTQAQRARFKREAESYLVDVSPAEAALRWDALRRPSRSTRPNERPRSQARVPAGQQLLL